VASDGHAGDFFGHSVSIHGDTIVIGAFLNDEVAFDAGAAYVFERNPGTGNDWQQTAKLTSSEHDAEDFFGRSVAMSGNIIVIGVDGDDDNGMNSGAAYVFTKDDMATTSTWVQTAKITTNDGAAEDLFGYSVAIDADTIVVGAYLDDDHEDNSGSVYLYDRNQGGENQWGETVKLSQTDAVSSDFFGYSVALDESTLVVASYLHNIAGGSLCL